MLADGRAEVVLVNDTDARINDTRSPRVPPTRQSPARLSTTGGPRPSSSHLPLSIVTVQGVG